MIRPLLTLFASLFSLIVAAQHPLEGTWEMVSIAGINVDGEKFRLDTTTIRETKIITATHYILLARDKEEGAWTFNRCYAGTVRMDGQKYYETPLISSVRIFENVTTDFTWRIEGDLFIQSGTITRPDGKKIILEEFIFQRVSAPAALALPIAGTWKWQDQKPENGLMLITPTHWIGIWKTGKSSNAAGGTVRNDKSGIFLLEEFGSRKSEGSWPTNLRKGVLQAGKHTLEKL